jgi:FtsH-binding integral membrane protein
MEMDKWEKAYVFSILYVLVLGSLTVVVFFFYLKEKIPQALGETTFAVGMLMLLALLIAGWIES